MGDQDTSNYPTEFMKQLAKDRQKNWETDSGDIRKLLKEASATEASFSDIESLKSFAKVYAAAKDVYLETMRGAAQDLEDAAKGISDSAKQMENRDANAGEAFIRLRDRWDASGLAAEERYKEATSRREVQQAATTVQNASETDPGVSTPTTPNEGEIPTDPTPMQGGTTTDSTPQTKEGEKEGETQYSAGRPTNVNSPVGG